MVLVMIKYMLFGAIGVASSVTMGVGISAAHSSGFMGHERPDWLEIGRQAAFATSLPQHGVVFEAAANVPPELQPDIPASSTVNAIVVDDEVGRVEVSSDYQVDENSTTAPLFAISPRARRCQGGWRVTHCRSNL